MMLTYLSFAKKNLMNVVIVKKWLLDRNVADWSQSLHAMILTGRTFTEILITGQMIYLQYVFK